MMDYWLDNSCLLTFLRKWRSDAVPKRRMKFMRKYDNHKTWPFIHNSVPMEEKPYHCELDPLIIPLVRHMNTLPEVETAWSCQGSRIKAPIVHFIATVEGSLTVANMFHDWHKQIHEGYYWNNPVISLEYKGRRWLLEEEQYSEKEELFWNLWLYDTLALVKFTKEYLGVPIAQQIIMPEGVHYFRKGYTPAASPTVEEWEAALSNDH